MQLELQMMEQTLYNHMDALEKLDIDIMQWNDEADLNFAEARAVCTYLAYELSELSSLLAIKIRTAGGVPHARF